MDRSVYPDMDDFWADLSAAYADEIHALGDLGCRYLQLDDTSLAYLNDPAQRAAMAARGEDAERQHLRYIAQINAALAGKPADMRVTTHMCRGNYRSSWAAEGGYDFVAEALFGELAVDGFFCEFDDERSGSFAPLRFVPPGKQVVLGLVTTKRGELEDADVLKRRIDEAAKYVPLDQLCLSPQCGFSSTVEGNTLTYDEQVAKLELIVRVAEDVWGVSLPTRTRSRDRGPAGWARPLYTQCWTRRTSSPGSTLLDLGCGTGEFARAAAQRGARVVGGRPGPGGGGSSRPRRSPVARFAVGDAQDLGPVDALGGPFAVVAAVQLLTHVANPLKLLREAARVAVPGGTLVMTVWGREQECDVRVFGEALAPWLPSAAPPAGAADADRPGPAAEGGLAGRAGGRRDRRGDVHVRLPRRRRRRWSTRCWRRGSGGRRSAGGTATPWYEGAARGAPALPGGPGAATGWRTCSGCWWRTRRDACAGGGAPM